jgi:hypothetical protein
MKLQRTIARKQKAGTSLSSLARFLFPFKAVRARRVQADSTEIRWIDCGSNGRDLEVSIAVVSYIR